MRDFKYQIHNMSTKKQKKTKILKEAIDLLKKFIR